MNKFEALMNLISGEKITHPKLKNQFKYIFFDKNTSSFKRKWVYGGEDGIGKSLKYDSEYKIYKEEDNINLTRSKFREIYFNVFRQINKEKLFDELCEQMGLNDKKLNKNDLEYLDNLSNKNN
jgi:hypothetical protein